MEYWKVSVLALSMEQSRGQIMQGRAVILATATDNSCTLQKQDSKRCDGTSDLNYLLPQRLMLSQLYWVPSTHDIAEPIPFHNFFFIKRLPE
jgi:hypothetical protein